MQMVMYELFLHLSLTLTLHNMNRFEQEKPRIYADKTIICLLPKNSLSHVYMDHSYTFLLEAFLCITLNNI